MTLNARWGLISYQSLLNGVMSLIECLHDNKLLNMSEKILQKARFQKINRKRNLYINSSFVGRSFQKIKRPHLCNSWRTSLFMRILLQEKKLCPQKWGFLSLYKCTYSQPTIYPWWPLSPSLPVSHQSTHCSRISTPETSVWLQANINLILELICYCCIT